MGLTFLNPLAFLGLFALALPLIIHLMELKRRRVVVIPTTRFIAEAHRRTSRRLRIRRWLLLAMRMLLILLLTLIVARPVIGRREALVQGGRPFSTVLLLDDSPSMGYREAGSSRGEEAARLAAELADRLIAAGGEVSVVTTSGRGETGFLADETALADAVGMAPPSVLPGNLASALSRAYRALEEASHKDRQVVFFTDMALPAWSRFDPGAVERPDLGVPIRVVDVSGGRDGWNVAVTGVEVGPRPGEQGGGGARVTVSAFGAVPRRTLTLQVELDGRLLSRRLVELEGQGSRSLDFALPRLDRGTHRLSASLDRDPLEFDDAFLSSFDFGGVVRVLTVDGSPRASLVGSETFFLKAALAPEGYGEERRFDNSVVFPGQLQGMRPDAFQVIILANVRSIPGETASALSSWVGAGGGLMIFLGDNYLPDTFQESFDAGGADLLPAFLGQTRDLPGGGSVAFADLESDLLQTFRAPTSGSLSRAGFTRYVGLDAGGLKPGARTLLALDREGREPLLVERRKGRGRVLLFTSSADLDWNNLATQPVYLPLLWRSLEDLAGVGGLESLPAGVAGEGLSLVLPEGEPPGALPVITPAGRKVEARVVPGPDGARAELPATTEAGYHVFATSGEEVPVAVNVTRAESDVSRAPDEVLAAAGTVLPLQVLAGDEATRGDEALQGATDPTGHLFALVILVLLAEGLVSILVRRERREPRAATS